jgi:hypothetical protein
MNEFITSQHLAWRYIKLHKSAVLKESYRNTADFCLSHIAVAELSNWIISILFEYYLNPLAAIITQTMQLNHSSFILQLNIAR